MNTHSVRLEVCVEDVAGVRESARLGADRAELCDNLAVGGTTPSIGAIESALLAATEQMEARREAVGPSWIHTDLARPFELIVMIRPRGGNFVYDSDESRAMIADARRIARLAQDMGAVPDAATTSPGGSTPVTPAVTVGFATGALHDDGRIDRGLITRLVEASGASPLTFHKAIDASADPLKAYEVLHSLGVARVLSSGAAHDAAKGSPLLAAMVATGGPDVVAAGHVRPENVEALVEVTGVCDVHMRCPVVESGVGPMRTDPVLVEKAVSLVHALSCVSEH
ncbi:copper homeostasis protein CutC [Actinomyces vulturis]|uniref:copper homeostasis protein CutC n=1 Tax=Actinomyces vulturis TaxID=1857645 RepID=UPI000830D255|nr:copper homeostasis protein CutC [Actinomyces vulturis]